MGAGHTHSVWSGEFQPNGNDVFIADRFLFVGFDELMDAELKQNMLDIYAFYNCTPAACPVNPQLQYGYQVDKPYVFNPGQQFETLDYDGTQITSATPLVGTYPGYQRLLYPDLFSGQVSYDSFVLVPFEGDGWFVRSDFLDYLVTDATIVPVPESETWFMALVGFVGVGMAIRRHRKFAHR